MNELQKIREILGEHQRQLTLLQGLKYMLPEYFIDIYTETLDKIQEAVDEEGKNEVNI